MASITVQARQLSKFFGKNVAIDNVSFSIDDNGIIGLVGRNGAGKTTLMKLCAGLTSASAGELKLWGESPLNNLAVLSRLIYSYHDVAYSSALKLKAILGDYDALFPDFDRIFAEGLLSYFDLDLEAKYAKLSKGMASTFNFICALACRAPLTMLDEPTLSMDVTVRKAAYEILVREYSEHPRIFIIASHWTSEIEGFLDALLIMDDGKLILHDSIEGMRQSAYQLEGDKAIIAKFAVGKDVIHHQVGETKSIAVVREPASDMLVREAREVDLNLSAVRPEDLYVYLTHENKGGDLECLWQKV